MPAAAEENLAPEETWHTEPGGDQFKGHYNLAGQPHGHGVIRFVSGEYYDGEFFCDKMDGHGRHKWPSGAEYEGQWDEDIRHGLGKYTFADGAVYEGRFKKNARDGCAFGSRTRAP